MLRSSSARRQYTVQQLNCIFHLYISNLIGNLLKEVRTLMIISSILYINYFIKIVGSLGQACLGRQCGMFILAIIVAKTLFFSFFFLSRLPLLYVTMSSIPVLMALATDLKLGLSSVFRTTCNQDKYPPEDMTRNHFYTSNSASYRKFRLQLKQVF